ncbi:MAG: hypothetical protein AB1742_00805 [bacterium]
MRRTQKQGAAARQAGGGALAPADEAPRVVQQIEIIAPPVRIEEHRVAACFQFIPTPGAAPANNPAEQAIRFVVMDRRVTQ